MMRLYGFVLAGKKVLILGFFCVDMRLYSVFFSLVHLRLRNIIKPIQYWHSYQTNENDPNL